MKSRSEGEIIHARAEDARQPLAAAVPGRSPWSGMIRFLFVVMVILGLGAAYTFLKPSSDPATLLAQAQADFKAGRLDAAERSLDRLARLRSPVSMDHMARAQIEVARERADAALSELKLISDTDPLAPLAHILAGQVEMKRGKVRAAEAHFWATLRLEPKAVQAHRELVYIYNVQHRQKEVDVHVQALSELGSLPYDELLHWSQTRNIVWNPERDCEALKRFIAADPDDRDSRLALSDGLRQLGHLREAEKVLAYLPEDDQQAKIRRILWAFDDGAPERAERLLARGIGNEPALARLRGQLALLRGDARTAVDQLQRAVNENPADRAALFGLAAALKFLGDESRARYYQDLVQKHDALTPLISRASTNEGKRELKLPSRIAAACEASDRLYEALAWYKNAIARDPLDADSQRAIFRLNQKLKLRSSDTATTTTQGLGPRS